MFLYRIRDVGVRVCCRRLRSPIVSTGRRFPLIASCRFCVHYHVRFLHIDLGSLPFFVLLQMFYCSIAVRRKVLFIFLRPKIVYSSASRSFCSTFVNRLLARRLVRRSCDLANYRNTVRIIGFVCRSYRLQASLTT